MNHIVSLVQGDFPTAGREELSFILPGKGACLHVNRLFVLYAGSHNCVFKTEPSGSVNTCSMSEVTVCVENAECERTRGWMHLMASICPLRTSRRPPCEAVVGF